MKTDEKWCDLYHDYSAERWSSDIGSQVIAIILQVVTTLAHPIKKIELLHILSPIPNVDLDTAIDRLLESGELKMVDGGIIRA